jgi:hypothetical protein
MGHSQIYRASIIYKKDLENLAVAERPKLRPLGERLGKRDEFGAAAPWSAGICGCLLLRCACAPPCAVQREA